MVNLGQQLRRLIFKLSSLREKILFRIFSGAVFEVQVAQVFVKLLFALHCARGGMLVLCTK